MSKMIKAFQTHWPNRLRPWMKRNCLNYSTATSVSRHSHELFKWGTNDKDFKEGTEVEGFRVKKVANISEFNMIAIKLVHEGTGAQYFHLAREDPNNVFCVGFRTTPTDSTGLPHILEHTTLCGSEKYPCRDPFFKMINRSMATFMNAMTGPDSTIYPFSTQNPVDFRNLMSVYLDAVFRPQLREMDFRQEGWRLEHANFKDKSSPIIFKGVVFNEMKGALSENQTRFYEGLLNNLLPSYTYGVISGGDPLVIPSLTYQDLKNFHSKYYHPSNCYIYSYGNFPLIEHLQYIEKEYLSDISGNLIISKSSEVPSEPRWEQERSVHVPCRKDPLAPNPRRQGTVAVATLAADIRSIPHTFALGVLSELLVSGPSAAFYRSLIEPGIGAGFAPATGYESQTKDTFFAVGLQGVDEADFGRVVEVYHRTIDKVIDDGFEENNVNAVLHHIELATKHQSANFGLNALFQLSPLWNHNGDAIQALRINAQVERLKKAMLDNPLYLQDLVQEYLKENQHRLVVTMSPDEAYERDIAVREEEMLTEKVSKLSLSEREDIFQQGLQLAADQDKKQDASCLPSLSVNDLNPDLDRTHLEGLLMHSVPVQVCRAPTNGVVYMRGVLNASVLSDEAKALLPLFCHVATRLGTTTKDYRQLDQMIKLKTGGMAFSPHLAQNIFDLTTFEEGVTFSSYCLSKNVKAMFQLWESLFNSSDFTRDKRFETLVHTYASGLVNGVCDSGHLYAMSLAESQVSPLAKIKEIFEGLTHVRFMKTLSLSSDLSETLGLMKGISDVLFKKRFLRTALNVTPGCDEKIFSELDGFLGKVKGTFEGPFCASSCSMPSSKATGVHHVLNFAVSHTAMSIPAVEYSHPDFPALRVMARLLSSKYLLPRVREKGGAYGAGARLSNHGTFSFFSYRDPRPDETFKTFTSARKWIESASEFSDADIDEAKLGVFQGLDAPIPPGSKGARNFLYGISDDELQRQRLAIIRLTTEDVVRAAKHLSSTPVGRALLGPANLAVSGRPSENWEVIVSN